MDWKRLVRQQALFVAGVLLFLIVIFLFVRAVTPSEIDDVHPSISCEADFLQRSDVLWVVPLYQNESIAVNRSWCADILSLNKTIGMHGIHHTFEEFSKPIDTAEFERGVRVFELCFGYRPTLFKAPQLALSSENEALVRGYGLHVRGVFHQQTRKVYHCNDSGTFPNWLVKWI